MRGRRRACGRLVAASLLSLTALAGPAWATDGPIFLFGGRDYGQFLGCLNCYRSEVFSVWNEQGEYGDPENPVSIWNRDGEYGSTASDSSPWNPTGTSPPIAVDRIGQAYGRFTRNPRHPNRIWPRPDHPAAVDFYFLGWLLANYDYVIHNLEDLRRQHGGRPERDAGPDDREMNPL